MTLTELENRAYRSRIEKIILGLKKFCDQKENQPCPRARALLVRQIKSYETLFPLI